MRILGIDPGVAIVGWGIVDNEKGKLSLVGQDCILTSVGEEHAKRLDKIRRELGKIIDKYKPDVLAVEELFFCKNVKTALKVGEARGVILATGMEYKLKIREFTPLQIKQALTGYGRAEKKQVQEMVKVILGLDKIIKQDDVADAVAVAITCANYRNYG